MKNQSAYFTPLGSEQLREINGGSFAYDAGRVLRYFFLSGGTNSLLGINATVDWIARDVLNG